MEVPKQGVQLELQLLAYATAIAIPDLSCVCKLNRSSQRGQILNPLSGTRDSTCIHEVLNLLSHNRDSKCCSYNSTDCRHAISDPTDLGQDMDLFRPHDLKLWNIWSYSGWQIRVHASSLGTGE